MKFRGSKSKTLKGLLELVIIKATTLWAICWMPLCCMFYVPTPNYECPTAESRERRDIINALLEKIPPPQPKEPVDLRRRWCGLVEIEGSSFVCAKPREGIDVRITKPLNLWWGRLCLPRCQKTHSGVPRAMKGEGRVVVQPRHMLFF